MLSVNVLKLSWNLL